MTTAFIPLAERFDIIDDVYSPSTSDAMDLPEPPESFDGPFDRESGFPESNRSFPCRLFLKQGCYQIRMEHGGILGSIKVPRYVGSLRVENDDGTQTISGDFYKLRPWTRPVSGRPGWTELFVDDIPYRGRAVIPIYPRKRYYSYLKVIDLRRSLRANLNKPCTITLTVEEYVYTHPEGTEVAGSFPETPSRVLTIVLRKAPNPEGYSGPSFEGSVYEGTRLLSYKFSMLWVSDFYRRAKLEMESIAGVTIPASAGAHDFRSIYASAGWDLQVVYGDTNLPIPSGVSDMDRWSRAELHEFMLANRNPTADLDKDWQMYHVSVPFDSPSPGELGLMFDEIEDQREGVCNFIQNFTGLSNDDRAKLRSAAHEVGHGFNQLHPLTEDLSHDNSIMSQTREVRTIIESDGGTYPDDINFAFNEHNRHHLVHFPDVVVRPGGEDFRFGHRTSFAPQAMDNADVAGLKLHIRPANNRLKLGEPLTLRIELLNNGGNTIRVPQKIGTAFHSLELVVSQSGKSAHHFRSFVIVCDGQDHIALKPGQNVGADETIFWDRNGFVFASPGMYLITATVVWDDAGQPFAVQATADLWVDYPVLDKDNLVAALLLHNEVGKYIALGGNAGHLEEAVARIERATEVAQDHPAVQRILKINQAGKKRRPEKQQKGG